MNIDAIQKFSHYTSTGSIYTLVADDIEVSGKAPSHALCRALVDKGVDGELRVFDELGNPRYTVPNIWLHSTTQTYEADSGFRTAIYKEYSHEH